MFLVARILYQLISYLIVRGSRRRRSAMSGMAPCGIILHMHLINLSALILRGYVSHLKITAGMVFLSAYAGSVPVSSEKSR